MDTTTNYGLSKPGLDGPADIEVLGQNADIVDTELKKAQDHRENPNVHMSTAEKGTLNSAVQSATFGGTAVPQDGTKLEIPMPTAAQVGASNPNLLINSNLKNPVNQREQSSYSTINQYTVDRWENWGNDTTITPTSNGLNISCATTGDSNIIRQPIEDYQGLVGKVLTVSIKHNGLSIPDGTKLSLSLDDGVNFQTTDITSSGDGIATLTYTMSTDPTKLNFSLIKYGTGTLSLNLEWAKLEIGSVATPFSPRPYAEELAMCQRYCYPLPYIAHYRSVVYNGDVEYFCIIPPVPMRITPTIIMGTEGTDWAVTTSTYDALQSGFTLSASGGSNGGSVMLMATKSSHGLTDNAIFSVLSSKNYLDSEIY